MVVVERLARRQAGRLFFRQYGEMEGMDGQILQTVIKGVDGWDFEA